MGHIQYWGGLLIYYWGMAMPVGVLLFVSFHEVPLHSPVHSPCIALKALWPLLASCPQLVSCLGTVRPDNQKKQGNGLGKTRGGEEMKENKMMIKEK